MDDALDGGECSEGITRVVWIVLRSCWFHYRRVGVGFTALGLRKSFHGLLVGKVHLSPPTACQGSAHSLSAGVQYRGHCSIASYKSHPPVLCLPADAVAQPGWPSLVLALMHSRGWDNVAKPPVSVFTLTCGVPLPCPFPWWVLCVLAGITA